MEVQLTRQLHYLKRILYGTCKAIIEHINIGEKYDQVKKVYSISILYCDFGREMIMSITGDPFQGIHTGNDLLVTTKEDGVIVTHLPKEVFPEYYLIRVNEYDKIPVSPLDEWLTYLKTGKVMEDTRTPGLQEVKRKLRYLSMTTKERRAYDAHMDNIMVQNDVLDTAREEGWEEGLAAGFAEGREKGHSRGPGKGHSRGPGKGHSRGSRRGPKRKLSMT